MRPVSASIAHHDWLKATTFSKPIVQNSRWSRADGVVPAAAMRDMRCATTWGTANASSTACLAALDERVRRTGIVCSMRKVFAIYAWRARHAAARTSAVTSRNFSHESNVGDPVALPAREAIRDVLAVEDARSVAQKGRVDTLERIHAHHSVEMIVDEARDQRHDAASSTDVELCRLRSELVLRHPRRIGDRDLERGFRIGRPHAAMLATERAGARARRYARRLRLPVECERNVAAVTASANEHLSSVHDRC